MATQTEGELTYQQQAEFLLEQQREIRDEDLSAAKKRAEALIASIKKGEKLPEDSLPKRYARLTREFWRSSSQKPLSAKKFTELSLVSSEMEKIYGLELGAIHGALISAD